MRAAEPPSTHLICHGFDTGCCSRQNPGSREGSWGSNPQPRDWQPNCWKHLSLSPQLVFLCRTGKLHKPLYLSCSLDSSLYLPPTLSPLVRCLTHSVKSLSFVAVRPRLPFKCPFASLPRCLLCSSVAGAWDYMMSDLFQCGEWINALWRRASLCICSFHSYKMFYNGSGLIKRRCTWIARCT